MQILKKTNWEGFKKATKLKREDIIKIVKDSELRGRSGSNFPTGHKWELMGKGERYLICNADEGEPGTFKDKFIIEHNLPLFIEGIAISSYALDVHKAIIYLRGEYIYLRSRIEKELKKSEKYFKKINLGVKIVVGAGSYLCGEETALLESIEGDRPCVREKPPYPLTVGLYGKPTCIDNVETLANIPLILLGNWNKGLELYSLSGDLKNPGVYEIEVGTPLEKIVSLGKPIGKPKAIYFGASGGCIPYAEFKHLHVDYQHAKTKGVILGARGLIVVGDKTNIVKLSRLLTEFFIHESCGYCTPCREGNVRMWDMLTNLLEGKLRRSELDILEKLAKHIDETSYCILGKCSSEHILCAMKYFKEDFLKLCK